MNKLYPAVLLVTILHSAPSYAGRGINVFIDNSSDGTISVQYKGDTCWYPNDMGHDFNISPDDDVQKYTEIKSSGVCPSQPSRLFFTVRDVKFQIKGTNGDIGSDYKHICTDSRAGFEVATLGQVPSKMKISCDSLSDRGILKIKVKN